MTQIAVTKKPYVLCRRSLHVQPPIPLWMPKLRMTDNRQSLPDVGDRRAYIPFLIYCKMES